MYYYYRLVVKRQQKKLVEKFSTFEVSATSCPRGKKYTWNHSNSVCVSSDGIYKTCVLHSLLDNAPFIQKGMTVLDFFLALVYDTYTAPTILRIPK